MEISELIREHTSYLYSYAKTRIDNETDLEDILQETFLAAYRGLSTFRSESTPRTWLVGILRNKILDYYRVKKNLSQVISMDAAQAETQQAEYPFRSNGWWQMDKRPLDWENTILRDLEIQEIRKHIASCIKNLPASMSAVYILRELEHRKTSEICELLSLHESHVNVLIYRARSHLRSCLEKFGIKDAAAN